MLSAGLKFKGEANKRAMAMLNKKEDKDETVLGQLTDYSVLDEYKVSAEGDAPPEPITDWTSFSSEIQESLKACGYEKPTPIQKYAISCFRNNRPLLAISPTGSGKTLGYALPLLDALKDNDTKDLQAVILVPTRELASQVYRQFKKFSGPLESKVQQLRKHRGFPKCQIIIATPKRLTEFSSKLSTVKYLVLDEADYLLSHSFVKQTDDVLQNLPKEGVYYSLFTATMTPKVEETARSFMFNPVRIQVGDKHAIAANIDQELKFVGTEKGKVVELKQRIQSGTIGLPCIIFVMNRQRAYDLSQELGYPSAVLTSDENDTERASAIRRIRTGEVQFLITTDLGGRGIDLAALKTVVNFDMPADTTTYIHRIGRTARAGRAGKAITLFTEDDMPNMRPVAIVMKSHGYDVDEYMLKPVDKKHRGARALFEPQQRKAISSKVWSKAKVRVPKGNPQQQDAE
ncbi:Type III restriction enzyme, res subunit family protein [Trichomonas vaginalis G3]|uniref:RNA helicase n=1 Tax=Trichomonas vaginalis (strain ATCC PRA-98 / G3) TaxID=412133 RepID=A2FQ89_TRIV3|nr:helicase protein [Trichomonas vaginalis G3]EAX92924.1 Type III restriction enzyme, res subunit family protein [Trichomonas vaginalis G3]KAI5510105.1 helicase protein [Trichomonas vaginalis G3]|eukprot:XP_001305854.1 Type III restriction enzyme, res subunit family protein [Trichomonas vaginalis G3]